VDEIKEGEFRRLGTRKESLTGRVCASGSWEHRSRVVGSKDLDCWTKMAGRDSADDLSRYGSVGREVTCGILGLKVKGDGTRVSGGFRCGSA